MLLCFSTSDIVVRTCLVLLVIGMVLLARIGIGKVRSAHRSQKISFGLLVPPICDLN